MILKSDRLSRILAQYKNYVDVSSWYTQIMKTVEKNSKNQSIKQVYQYPFVISVIIAFIWFILPSIIAHAVDNLPLSNSKYLLTIAIVYYLVGGVIIFYGTYKELKVKQNKIMTISVSILAGIIISIIFIYMVSIFNYIAQ